MTCSKVLSIAVAANPALLKICDYGTLQPLLIPDPASDASADPEWNGTFDTFHTCFGDPTYMFLGQVVSIQGKALAQGVLCNVPAIGGQRIYLTQNLGTTWRLTVTTAVGAGDSIVWQGDLVSGSPIGTYDYVAGNDPRLTLDICAG